MKISTRIVITVTVSTALLMFALVFYIVNEALRIQEKTALNDLKNMAYRYAAVVDAELEIPLDASRTVANMFSQKDALPRKQRREIMLEQLKGVLEQNPNFLAAWTKWESDAVDANDEKYRNANGHDANGQFLPKWKRNGNGIDQRLELVSFSGDNIDKADYYYSIAKKTGKEVIVNPFLYNTNERDKWITSLIAPIIIDGEFVGVVGVDMSIDLLQKMVENIHPYDDGYSFIVANDSDLVAIHDTAFIGKKAIDFIQKSEHENFLTALANGEELILNKISPITGESAEYVYAPIKIGNSDLTWMFAVSVPTKTILAGVNRVSNIAIASSLIALLFLVLIVWLVGRTIQLNIHRLLAEIKNLREAGRNGDLSYRAKQNSIHNDFLPVINAFNEVMDTLVTPLNLTSDYVKRISEGDIPDPITEEYHGDFNKIKSNLNTMIHVLNNLTGEMNSMYKEQAAGDYEYYMDASVFNGVYLQVANGYNQVVKLHVDNILGMLDIVGQYGDGNFKEEMPQLPGKQIVATQIINQVRENLLGITSEIGKLTVNIKTGNLNSKADPSAHKGEFKVIIEGINEAISSITSPLNELIAELVSITNEVQNGNLHIQLDEQSNIPEFEEVSRSINGAFRALIDPLAFTADYIDKIAKGSIPEKIDIEYKGDFNIIKDNLNTLIDVVNGIISSIIEFTNNTQIGEIEKTRIDVTQYSGVFEKIISAINHLAVYISTPLMELAVAMDKIGKGESTNYIQMEGYQGRWVGLRDSMNSLIDITGLIAEQAQQIAEGDLTIALRKRSENDMLVNALQNMTNKLSDTVRLINTAADNVAAGSDEVSNNASSLAQGANEQASSVEEVSASIEEMEATLVQNTENAQITEQTALKAAKEIEVGSDSVQTTVAAMRTIIEKIQIVTDLADKTDLLAINAAIEAARAGEHGEGFAVVAGEVRKLAEMSKEAAKEINQVSKDSLRIAEVSGDQLKAIVPQIKDTARLVQEIATSSLEQRSGVAQMTHAITELNNLSQQNAASAEELSTGSEELTSQADSLRDSISYFTVIKKHDGLDNVQIEAQKQFLQTSNRAGAELNMNFRQKNDDTYEKF